MPDVRQPAGAGGRHRDDRSGGAGGRREDPKPPRDDPKLSSARSVPASCAKRYLPNKVAILFRMSE